MGLCRSVLYYYCGYIIPKTAIPGHIYYGKHGIVMVMVSISIIILESENLQQQQSDMTRIHPSVKLENDGYSFHVL